MLPRLHVGLTVWPARSDFFFALRRWISSRAPEEAYQAFSLPDEMLQLVTRVEYSSRWLLRFFFYRKVARLLEAEMERIMREAQGRYREVIFYTPDDGYWAELLHTIRGRIGGPIRILNLQHGHASTVAKPQALRRLLNRVAVLLSRYPNFGYGFGGGSLDGYVVMSSREADFIRSHFTTPAYILPGLLRGDFFVDRKAPAPEVSAVPRILFAISPIFARKSNLFGARDKAEKGYLRDIADMLQQVKAAIPCDIIFRFHPGTNPEVAAAQFHAVGLDCVAAIDTHHSVLDALLDCDFAIAYNSTVLIEAALLGKVPVNFVPAAYPPRHPLGIEAETVWLTRDVSGAAVLSTSQGPLPALFTLQVQSRYSPVLQELDYTASLPWL